ncbi:MAG: 16S rRNA processing protein RimM [Muribaculaceae bacterium]|nr:16S rRNA processing protein RimM [Muribaculaceae bacterium]
MIRREDLIEIGIFNKPHGVNGEISATVDCDLEVMERFSCVVTEMDGIFVPFFVSSYRTKGRSTILMQIDGLKSDEDAATLTNKRLYVRKQEYDDLMDELDADEYPTDYFVGYEVAHDGGEVIGTVTDVDDSTENVLFRVRTAGGEEVLIPAVDEFITEIDAERKRLVVDLPSGLLDL